jgi:hypothetical protein
MGQLKVRSPAPAFAVSSVPVGIDRRAKGLVLMPDSHQTVAASSVPAVIASLANAYEEVFKAGVPVAPGDHTQPAHKAGGDVRKGDSSGIASLAGGKRDGT